MKKIGFLAIALFLGNLANATNKAAAQIVAQNNRNIQVIVDGHLINSQPKQIVSMVGKAGFHQVTIKVFDNCGKILEYINDYIMVKPGYKSHFALEKKTRHSELKKVKMEPYSKRNLKKPDYYYNHRYYALHARPCLYTGMA